MYYIITEEKEPKRIMAKSVDSENSYAMFFEKSFKREIVDDPAGNRYNQLRFTTVNEAMNFIFDLEPSQSSKWPLIVEGRTGREYPWSMQYGDKIPFELLTEGEIALVSLIYDSYTKWSAGHGLKNSMFEDFKSDMELWFESKPSELAKYANYMYLCKYDRLVRNQGDCFYPEQLPLGEVSRFYNKLYEVLEKRFPKTKKKKTFWEK